MRVAIVAGLAALLSTSAAFADTNGAYIFQVGELQDADITQDGVKNVASIYQADAANETDGLQAGEGNFADIGQGVTSDREPSKGTENTVIFDQVGDSNILSVTQLGRGNGIESRQGSDEINGFGNYAAIFQSGDANAVINEQYGSDGDLSVAQIGDSNIVVNADFGSNNELDIIQTGAGNYSETALGGSDATILLTQTGDSNVYLGADAGVGSSVIVDQFGDANVAFSTQSGAGDTIVISQGSGGVGNFNFASVTQSD